MTVYTGHWKKGLVPYFDRWPDLLLSTETEMYERAKDNPSGFDGLWVNSVMILQAMQLEDVVVVLRDGREVRMSDDPSMVEKYKVMDAGEAYIDTDWDNYEVMK